MRILFILFLALLFLTNCDVPSTQIDTNLPKESSLSTPNMPESSPTPDRLFRDEYETEVFRELTQTDKLIYNGYEIQNTEKGLLISRNGKRLEFIPNSNDLGKAGVIGLKSFLRGSEKQFVYETWTGGNHCCSYSWIFDLNSDKPRIIYRSTGYDVSELRTFDIDNDGNLEIAQSFFGNFMFIWDDDCAMVTEPVIEVNFKYNQKEKRYLPLKEFTWWQKKWLEEEEQKISDLNDEFKTEKYIPSCTYKSNITSVALRYIFIGKENDGFDYFSRTYLHRDKKKLEADIKYNLLKSKLYKAIYNR